MESFFSSYGLVAVFLGAAIEGDASVIAGGALYQKGLFGFWHIVLTAALGAWISDMTIYWLARLSKGLTWVDRTAQAIHRNRLVSTLVSRPFLLAVTFRFLPGARTLGPVALATAGHVRGPAYAVITAAAALTWALILVVFGQVVTHLIEAALGQLRPHFHIAIWGLAILASLAAAFILRRRWIR